MRENARARSETERYAVGDVQYMQDDVGPPNIVEKRGAFGRFRTTIVPFRAEWEIGAAAIRSWRAPYSRRSRTAPGERDDGKCGRDERGS
jgi:hypothetical protein